VRAAQQEVEADEARLEWSLAADLGVRRIQRWRRRACGYGGRMDTSLHILEYIKVLVWPIVAAYALVRFGGAIASALGRSKVKLSLFGVEIEVPVSQLEQVLTAAVGGRLSAQQWALLEQSAKDGVLSVAKAGYRMTMDGDLPWVRPVRNAGLIMTLPDGQYIEQATDIVLTPLGKVLMSSRAALPAEARGAA
jgi:hypothetical protein